VDKIRPGSSPGFGTIFCILSHPWGITAKVGSPFSLWETKKVKRGMGIVMKRLLVLLMMYLFLTGCGAAARQSEFWQHESIYWNGSHLWFSWYDHKQADYDDVLKSRKEKWWGIPVYVEPPVKK
jgi:hypothetical protein